MDASTAKRVECVECGEPMDDRRGWGAYLTVEDEVAFYCPLCAEYEFGVNDG